MKPSCWSNELDHIWAKSAKAPGEPGEGLVLHTWSVLCRLADLAHSKPHQANGFGAPCLWHCLFWAGMLHDLGKVARGFQDIVHARATNGTGMWGNHRHEVLSLAFLDWIAPGLSETEQLWILAAVVSHHRDARDILLDYNSIADPDPLESLLQHLDKRDVQAIWRWLTTCSSHWIHDVDLAAYGVRAIPLVTEEEAVYLACQEGVQRTRHWLNRYRRWIQHLPFLHDQRDVAPLILLRGLLTTADHTASAHLSSIPHGIQRSWHDLASTSLGVRDPLTETYQYQREVVSYTHQSVMLEAPTGSGKTEAALFWALGDGKQHVPRIFYVLPYQASMNAMLDRLDAPAYFGPRRVGLQHGRALQSLYYRLMHDQWASSGAALRVARWQHNVARLHAHAIKVFSAYQMLKVVYEIRGYEGSLADYSQATFILDEIHAYEPERLAVILQLVKHLREYYGARFLVMSATFPKLIQQELAKALDTSDVIRADDTLFQRFQRHRLHLLSGDLLDDGLPHILADVRAGRSILVCCNTIRRAQQMKALLASALGDRAILLTIHGLLIQQDRQERERLVRAQCEVGVQRSGQPVVVVATQVVEVSLNISLDTIYTDPAPLDALIQRFGRVNRRPSSSAHGEKRLIAPVHVFTSPDTGQGIYWGSMVQKTLAVLTENQGVIDEAKVGTWLDEIYAEPAIAKQWTENYEQAARQAAHIIKSIRPFGSQGNEHQFEALFDGIEIVPECYEQHYLASLAQGAFIEAAQYTVTIRQRTWQRLKQAGKLRPLSDGTDGILVALLAYDSDGLHLAISTSATTTETEAM